MWERSARGARVLTRTADGVAHHHHGVLQVGHLRKRKRRNALPKRVVVLAYAESRPVRGAGV